MKSILLLVVALCIAIATAVPANSDCNCNCGNYSEGETIEEGSGQSNNSTVPPMPDFSGILPPWLGGGGGGGGFPFSG
uniref:Putative 6 kDa family secreted peptide n=1 Tax=Anopheles darlingi TaxID=43151 RepID=B6DE23_ANODA